MKYLALCVLFCITFTVHGQFTKLRTLDFSDSVVTAFIDRPGDLYVISRQGQLQHFDKDGKLLSLYKKNPGPDVFEPRDGSRLFAYFRTKQQYAYLNPSFDITHLIQLDSAFSIDPWLVCSSGDHNIWILDATEWSIKKIDIKKGIVLTEAVLPADFSKQKSDYLTLREYQGFLFISDKTKGVHIFNGMGKFMRTLIIEKPRYFNFLGEELYFQSDNQLHFFDLFTTETRTLKLPSASMFSLLTDERLFLVNHRHVDIFIVK